MENPIVEIRNLWKNYLINGEVIHALRGVNLKVNCGEYLSLLGPSGSGKTTLLNLIGCLDTPTDGDIFIDGIKLSSLNSSKLAWIRRQKIGFIFQTFNLVPILSAIDNVSLPMIFSGVSLKFRRKRAEDLLESVGLVDCLHHKPTELSVGQQQRVAIARALANNPSIILADEPTASLDRDTSLKIVKILKDLNRDTEVTVICATHNSEITDVSDRVIQIRNGKIELESALKKAF